MGAERGIPPTHARVCEVGHGCEKSLWGAGRREDALLTVDRQTKLGRRGGRRRAPPLSRRPGLLLVAGIDRWGAVAPLSSLSTMHRVPTILHARRIGNGVLESVLFRTSVSACARSLHLSAVAAVPANKERLPTALSRRRLSLGTCAATEGRLRGYQVIYAPAVVPVVAPAMIVRTGTCRGFSSSTHASLLGDDGFDPFITHHNAEDADRADRMVRDYVTRRLAGGAAVKIRKDFVGGALNSYRVLSERAAEQARKGKNQK